MRAFVFLLLLTPAIVFAQRKGFEISGQLTGLANGSPIFLTDGNNPTDTVVKDVLKEGKFKLTGNVNEPNLYYLNFGGKKKDLLFVGNDAIKVSGSIDDLKTLKITGSASHADFVQFQEIFNPLFQRNAIFYIHGQLHSLFVAAITEVIIQTAATGTKYFINRPA